MRAKEELLREAAHFFRMYKDLHGHGILLADFWEQSIDRFRYYHKKYPGHAIEINDDLTWIRIYDTYLVPSCSAKQAYDLFMYELKKYEDA